MKKPFHLTRTHWSSILVISVILCSFVTPVLPGNASRTFDKVCLTLIFLSGVMSLDRKKWFVLVLSLSAFFLEWISGMLNLVYLSEISRALNLFFFLLVVFYMVWQMAMARIVSPRVILESIAGYLLLGLIFSTLVDAIMLHDPAAYNITFPNQGAQPVNTSLSVPFYYGFITMATVGYGDIVPLKPYARSLAMIIGISGQLYIAIIIAMLVGKFAGKQMDEK
ncbi:MAG: ion channel [Bacteroidales bacterium]|nr:ion channel [Bacteroidales bacterium]